MTMKTKNNTIPIKKDDPASGSSQVEVIFRKEKGGSIFAFFPYEIADYNKNMTCYAHIGQHSAMNPDYILSTKPATPEEYKDLFQELVSIGYDLKIIRRINWRKYLKAVDKSLYTECVKTAP